MTRITGIEQPDFHFHARRPIPPVVGGQTTQVDPFISNQSCNTFEVDFDPLDADDRLDATYLEACLARMKPDSQIGICTTDVQFFGLKYETYRPPVIEINQMNWIHAGSLVRRSALIASKAFECAKLDDVVSEDWFIWRRVIASGFAAVKIDKPLYQYRKHGQSRSDRLSKGRDYYSSAGLRYELITVVVLIRDGVHRESRGTGTNFPVSQAVVDFANQREGGDELFRTQQSLTNAAGPTIELKISPAKPRMFRTAPTQRM